MAELQRGLRRRHFGDVLLLSGDVPDELLVEAGLVEVGGVVVVATASGVRHVALAHVMQEGPAGAEGHGARRADQRLAQSGRARNAECESDQ